MESVVRLSCISLSVLSVRQHMAVGVLSMGDKGIIVGLGVGSV